MKDLRERFIELRLTRATKVEDIPPDMVADIESFAREIRNEARLEDAELIEKRTREDVAVHEESSGVRAEDYYSWRIAQEIRMIVADPCILAAQRKDD